MVMCFLPDVVVEVRIERCRPDWNVSARAAGSASPRRFSGRCFPEMEVELPTGMTESIAEILSGAERPR